MEFRKKWGIVSQHSVNLSGCIAEEKCLLRGTDLGLQLRQIQFVFNPYPANAENMVSS